MTPKITLRKALTDPALLGDVLGGDTWRAWRSILLGAMGEPLTPDELKSFKTFTGRDAPPAEPVEAAALNAKPDVARPIFEDRVD